MKDNILTKEQQDAFKKFTKTIAEADKYNYKGNYYIYPINDKYNVYSKIRNIPFSNMDMSIYELLTKHARYICSQHSELEAKIFIDGMIYSQENCFEETMMIHAIKQSEKNKTQKQATAVNKE